MRSQDGTQTYLRELNAPMYLFSAAAKPSVTQSALIVLDNPSDRYNVHMPHAQCVQTSMGTCNLQLGVCFVLPMQNDALNLILRGFEVVFVKAGDENSVQLKGEFIDDVMWRYLVRCCPESWVLK